MGILLLVLVLVAIFGSVLTGLGVYVVRELRRIGHEVATLADEIAAAEADGEEPQPPRRPVLTIIKGGLAPVVALLILARRHWIRTASAAAGVIGATALALGLVLAHGPAPAGPPEAGHRPTTGPTQTPSSPAATPSTSSSPPGTVHAPAPAPTTASRVSSIPAQTAPVRPAAARTSTTPAPSHTPAPRPSSPAPTPPASTPSATSSPCALGVDLAPLLGLCVL